VFKTYNFVDIFWHPGIIGISRSLALDMILQSQN